MDYKDWINLSAILISPVIAVLVTLWYQKQIEMKREKKNILAVLMAYRGLTAYEDDFVKALNMIDVYFYNSKKVRKLCHDYFYSLDQPIYETGQHVRILRSLILAMAKDCGYKGILESDIDHYYFPERYIQQYGAGVSKNEP